MTHDEDLYNPVRVTDDRHGLQNKIIQSSPFLLSFIQNFHRLAVLHHMSPIVSTITLILYRLAIKHASMNVTISISIKKQRFTGVYEKEIILLSCDFDSKSSETCVKNLVGMSDSNCEKNTVTFCFRLKFCLLQYSVVRVICSPASTPISMSAQMRERSWGDFERGSSQRQPKERARH